MARTAIRSPTSVTCALTFTITDVPSGISTHQIEVAQRGKLTETPEELAIPLALTLGS